ncbi:MAG: 4Fe-4S binding protein [Nitrospirota bacterium]|nr:MAG: 4Fe-4S binding protein [Nitrospirota bacterium]
MKLKNWKELALGSVIPEAGNADTYNTGSWRTFRPERVEENCINCLFCWVYCPDSSVIVKDEKMSGFDYEHCKGCGICEHQCPGKKGNKAIKMVEEGK